MFGDTVAIGIYSRKFDLARIEASVDEETCIQDRVPEEAEGWTYLIYVWGKHCTIHRHC